MKLYVLLFIFLFTAGIAVAQQDAEDAYEKFYQDWETWKEQSEAPEQIDSTLDEVTDVNESWQETEFEPTDDVSFVEDETFAYKNYDAFQPSFEGTDSEPEITETSILTPEEEEEKRLHELERKKHETKRARIRALVAAKDAEEQ